MATRLYLPASTATTRISPTPDAAWEDTTALARIVTDTAKISDALATLSFADNNAVDRDVLLRQYVTKLPLTVGQTITGGQALKFQVRAKERAVGNNMFTTLGIRVVNGSTVNKTVLVVTRDGVEINEAALVNRQFNANSAAGNYTTVTGDFLVIEVGAGGDPGGGQDHDYDLRLGDAAVSDLAENNTATTDDNPWVELTDTLTFLADTTITPPTTAAAITAFAPTVTATNNQLVTPPTLALALTAFAPTVRTPRLVTPPTTALALATFAPSVLTPRLVTPPVLALSITSFAPTVTATQNQRVTPPIIALILTSFAPSILAPRLVTPPIAALILSAFAPTVTVSGGGDGGDRGYPTQMFNTRAHGRGGHVTGPRQ